MKTMVKKGNKGRSPIAVFLKALLVWVIVSGVWVCMNLVPNATSAAEDSANEELTFDHIGYIDRVDDEGLVIDDRLVKFTASTKYYSRTNGRASRSQFRNGIKVRYSINEKKEITAIGLVGDE